MANDNIIKYAMIDEDMHEKSLQYTTNDNKVNPIPKGVVSLEKLYDLRNCFKGPRNTKTHSSTLMHKQINLGIERDLKFVNLSMCCTPEERQAFVQLFKQYHDVCAWTHDDLKTYDMRIIQDIIPIKEGVKSFQKNLKNVHPSLVLSASIATRMLQLLG